MIDAGQRKEGFTLAEAMIAISLIALGMVGILALLNSSLRLAAVVRDELTAANLGQEGIEIVRAIRDESWIADDDFDEDLPAGTYRVHYLQTTLLPSADTPLLLNPTTNLFQYDSGLPTTFRRAILITEVNPNELRVTSRVTWQSRGVDYTLDVEDHFFNWFVP